VISQLQTAGNGPAPADDEFVELYNPTSSPVSLAGLSLQYKSATGSSYLVVALAAHTIPAHGWYLVARSSYNGATAADQLQTGFLMSAAGGHVFLVNGTGALAGACSTAPTILDKLGYGTGNCPEATVAPAPSADNGVVRRPAGSCGNGQDTNDNAADFVTLSPAMPRNRFSSPQP
jgi:hypothetical protein